MRLIEALCCSSIGEESRFGELREILATLSVRAAILSQVFWTACGSWILNPDTLLTVSWQSNHYYRHPIFQMRKLRPRWRNLSCALQWDQLGFEPMFSADFQILCKLWSSSAVWEGSPFSDLLLRSLEQLAFLWLGPKSIPWALGWRADGLLYKQKVTTYPSAELPKLHPFWALSSKYCKEDDLGSSDVVWVVWGSFSSPDMRNIFLRCIP